MENYVFIHKYYIVYNIAASFEVTEADLVRDIVYVLQGIDGKYVKFDAASDMYKVDSKVSLSTRQGVTMLILCY